MIQPLAFIHPSARIAENVIIDPFTVIHKNVEIGEGTWIGSNVTIMEGARIGRNCRIFPGAVISAIPQDLKFRGEETTAVIGDGTTIREFVTINRGTADRFTTRIGAGCLIMAYVHVAHDCIIGDHCILANGVTMAGHVQIGDYANIGGLTAIQQFVSIGAHSYVAGGSLVRKDIPPYVKAAKEPISYMGVNSVGLRRRGFPDSKIAEVQEIYRTLYLKNYNISKALEIIETEMPPSPERDEILLFIQKSKKGIMKRHAQDNDEAV
ncbi:MAG: acyl-ACP--UDP-N-acetylglucosamine O-acyltransferase [Flavobacteriales bacterium]|nr:acyl-ACP--UDP-N-acetylglucosamine O-acyltransferase [Flavobacteriales bacterium]MCX7650685.1 acyl-ACP--UDP-N-acetylglucosamine O-acyltransferase [Flavobacteriales bacterium]MDW8431138.1 acyl-ACP--UDP-N-acetylglucosamine O-acyltransferase [Flavobacteriales bacterium]